MPTTTAGREYARNLEFFAGLRNKTGKFQLEFDKGTGLFSSYSGSGFTRTMGNMLSGGSKQSVKNDDMFANPIKDVFMEAVLNGAGENKIKQALDGIVKLSNRYSNDKSKLAKIKQLIQDLRSLTGINLIQNTLSNELVIEFKTIDKKTVLTDDDTDFTDKVWLQIESLLREIEQATRMNFNHQEKYQPYAYISNKIYSLYNAYQGGVKIGNLQDWVNSLPNIMNKGKQGLYLQHNEKFLEKNEIGQIVKNEKYGKDFIYYTIGRQSIGQQLWRIYLNFSSDHAGGILQFILNQKNSPIHSFKIAGPLAFHKRADKVVVYIYGRPEALRLAENLSANCDGFENPVPAMTQKVHTGIALGIEPDYVETGFSHDVNPLTAKRQSYGSLRAQLITAALVHFYENAEYAQQIAGCEKSAYLGSKEIFEKWVAIAFKNYKNYLDPSAI